MERDVMDIIRDKEFIELTAADRAELGEMCSSEDEFDQVKSMFAGMSAINWSNPAPKVETKERLDHLFAQKHPKAAPIWYTAPLAVIAPKGKPFYRQPLIQAAAVGLLIFLAYPLVTSNSMTTKSNQLAVLEKEMTSSEEKKSDKLEKTDFDKQSEIKTNDLETTLVETRNEAEPNRQTPKGDLNLSNPVASTSATPMRSIDGIAATPALVSNVDDKVIIRGTAGDNSAAKPGSNHPDGIFIADRAEVFSVPASKEPAVFDLLTSTF